MITNGYKISCSCGRCHSHNTIQVDVLTLLFFLEHQTEPGEEIVITSGARCKAHNKSVGGANGSNHVTKRAIDFTVVRCGEIAKDTLNDLFNYAKRQQSLFPYSDAEVIIYDTFLHIAVREGLPPKYLDKRKKS